MSGGMSKVERVRAAIAGERVDRVPVALWRHFPVDDQLPESLAEVTVAFQREYDFDLVKVSPSSSFCLRDWGVQDEWKGNIEGTREYIVRPVQEPSDWAKLQPLDPYQGALGAQLVCLRTIIERLGADVPVIQTVFSPLAQAKNLASETTLLIHLRRYPTFLYKGLEVIAETTERFIRAVAETGASGVFYAVQHAQYGLLSEGEFETFGRAFDLQVLRAAERMWCNMLHVHGVHVMFDRIVDYPVQIVNWHDRETEPSLAEGLRRFGGAVCGGLDRWRDLTIGTAEGIRKQAEEAFVQTNGHRWILGTGCVVPIVAPVGNLRAAREVVEQLADS